MSDEPTSPKIKEICESLIGSKTYIGFTTTLKSGENLSNQIYDCNIVGNSWENILFPVIKEKIPTFQRGPPGQKPDYLNIYQKKKKDYEVKCFNSRLSPKFDIGSITGYLNDISKENGVQKKLDTTYLVFEYDVDDEGFFEIKKFWMLSVWELCCGHTPRKSAKKLRPIGIGGQSGVDIRPAGKGTWTDKKNKEKRTPSNFLNRIEQLIQSNWYKVDESEKQNKLESIRAQRNSIGI